MAKYNFWVRTTKQTNHPMKGIEMEFGECLQMFNDYMTLLEKHGCEIIDAEIYRIQPGAEVPAESCDGDAKPADTVNCVEVVREAIRNESEICHIVRLSELLAHKGVTQQVLDKVIPSLLASEEISVYGCGYVASPRLFELNGNELTELADRVRSLADEHGEFCGKQLSLVMRHNLNKLVHRGVIECVHATGDEWRVLPKMSSVAGRLYYQIKVALRMKESPLSFKTLLAEIGEENKPELQAAFNELVEVGLIKRLAGGKGGCRYDVTFKPNVI